MWKRTLCYSNQKALGNSSELGAECGRDPFVTPIRKRLVSPLNWEQNVKANPCYSH